MNGKDNGYTKPGVEFATQIIWGWVACHLYILVLDDRFTLPKQPNLTF